MQEKEQWEELKRLLQERITRAEKEKLEKLSTLNTWENVFDRIKQLIECEGQSRELSVYQRILATMKFFEQTREES